MCDVSNETDFLHGNMAVSFFTERHSPKLNPTSQLEVILAITDIHSSKRISRSRFYVAVRMIQFHQNLLPIVHLDLSHVPEECKDMRKPYFENIHYNDMNIFVSGSEVNGSEATSYQHQRAGSKESNKRNKIIVKTPLPPEGRSHHDHRSSSSLSTEQCFYVSSQQTSTHTVADAEYSLAKATTTSLIPYEDFVQIEEMTPLDRRRYEDAYFNEYNVHECFHEHQEQSSFRSYIFEELSLGLKEGVSVGMDELDKVYELVTQGRLVSKSQVCAQSPSGRLSKSEFCVAMHILAWFHKQKRCNGTVPLLSFLPASVRAAKNDMDGIFPVVTHSVGYDTNYCIKHVDGPFTISFRSQRPKCTNSYSCCSIQDIPILSANEEDRNTCGCCCSGPHNHHIIDGMFCTSKNDCVQHFESCGCKLRQSHDYVKLEREVKDLGKALNTALNHVQTLTKEISLIRAGMAASNGHEEQEMFTRRCELSCNSASLSQLSDQDGNDDSFSRHSNSIYDEDEVRDFTSDCRDHQNSVKFPSSIRLVPKSKNKGNKEYLVNDKMATQEKSQRSFFSLWGEIFQSFRRGGNESGSGEEVINIASDKNTGNNNEHRGKRERKLERTKSTPIFDDLSKSERSDAFFTQMMNSSRSLHHIRQTNQQRRNSPYQRRLSTKCSARRQFEERSKSVPALWWFPSFRK